MPDAGPGHEDCVKSGHVSPDRHVVLTRGGSQCQLTVDSHPMASCSGKLWVILNLDIFYFLAFKNEYLTNTTLFLIH